MDNIKYITIHCSATKEGQDFHAETVRQWHMNKGWSDIGYHYVVPLDGDIESGRDRNRTGAHVKGYNRDNIGICYIGGLDSEGNPKDTRTPAQKEALMCLLKDLREQWPNAVIRGHRDFPGVAKACPCFDAEEEYKDV